MVMYQQKKQISIYLVLLMLTVSILPVSAQGITTRSKAVVSFQTKKDSYYNRSSDVLANFSYQMPQLKGSSVVVKEINASIKKDYKTALKNKKRCFDYAKDATSEYRGGEFYTKTSCKVSYNYGGYVSFKFHSKWMAGGVGNIWTYGLTYDLKTGKKLNVSDVISGNNQSVKQKIIKGYCSQITDNEYARSEIRDTKISKFQFYLKDGKVKVCFGPYQPGGGNGESQISLTGNYR